jgi:hypothetical protein
MQVKLWMCEVLLACLFGLIPISCRPQPATSVLFIGNSYTYVNEGVDAQLGRMAPSIRTFRIAAGGYTLEKHWKDGNALRSISSGHWSYVILQEQSQIPVIDPMKFRNYVEKFNEEINRIGAKTILLMTWERPDSVGYGVTAANISAAYNAAGEELGITVAPAGLAFENALQERPDLALYSQDGHPTIAGTYLAACVLYGTIFQKSPAGIACTGKNIPPDLRDFLQRIAAKSLGY